LLAEVAPISSTHRGSSDLKIRDSSAMALDRRVTRSCALGAGNGAGVLRKNFIDLFALGLRHCPIRKIHQQARAR
jgi:hypothetical protein